MNYELAVRETWRHQDLANVPHDLAALVRYATLAASSHNTQPWKFRLERRRISILPDMSRRCPQVDPDDHHLYASIGCAAENLFLAAQAAGLRGHLSDDVSSAGVQVCLEHAPAARSALFEAIPHRQCSRSPYDGTAVPKEQLRLLEDAGRGRGVSVLLLTGENQKEQVAEYVTQGNRAQIGDSRWVEELKAWIRFNAREAVRTGDGLYGRAMGAPEVPRWLGSRLMRLTLTEKAQNRKDLHHIRSSAGIAVFFSEVDDRRHWTEAGRSYERFALQATALDLRTAFINQPVEVPALRPQFASWLGIGHCRPDLVVRFGRGGEMPRSLRRPVEQVLIAR